MFSLVLLYALSFLTFVRFSQCASQIALFTDDSCKNSLRGMTGPNGYPNGTCTDLRRTGPYGSFQVVGLDEGCAVTIYKNDTTTDPCSGFASLATPIACYNSTYVYYSIDMCLPGGAQASSVPTPSPSTTPTSSGPSAGAIAGSVVGGVVGLGIIIAIILFVVLKKKKKAKELAAAPHESGGAEVLPQYHQMPHEIGRGSMIYKNNAVEIEQPPIELGGRDHAQPTAELGGREMSYQDLKSTH
ncbi:hypothetical protein NX059_004757 [Plenodomus lindquistii]|nr:hypothetical protein NX059_004757 [Plenodomus lindquistii]